MIRSRRQYHDLNRVRICTSRLEIELANFQITVAIPLIERIYITSESVRNAELMQRLSLVPKLLFVLQDDSVTDATAHTIASVLSVLLSNTNDKKNLLRYEIYSATPNIAVV